MPMLTWKPELELRQPLVDGTHREFVELLGAVETAAPGADVDRALAALLAHTEAHFAQEERWLAALGFAGPNCHTQQHAGVLEVLREVARRHAEAADADLVARLVAALAEWFTPHATMLDAGLVQAMAESGFDPEAGTFTASMRAGGDNA